MHVVGIEKIAAKQTPCLNKINTPSPPSITKLKAWIIKIYRLSPPPAPNPFIVFLPSAYLTMHLRLINFKSVSFFVRPGGVTHK